MSTTEVTASKMAEGIFAQTDVLLAKLDGQVLVSQNRWVDHLLDLYNLVDSRPLQRAIEETLSAIRHLGSVDSSWLREQLLAITAALEVESAFDPSALPTH
jgi:hypothetical protein